MKYIVVLLGIFSIFMLGFTLWNFYFQIDYFKDVLITMYSNITFSVENNIKKSLMVQKEMESSIEDLLYNMGYMVSDNDIISGGALLKEDGNIVFIYTNDISVKELKEIINDMKKNDADEVFFPIEGTLWGYVAHYPDKKRYFFTTYKYPFIWMSEDKGAVVDFVRKYKNKYVKYIVYQINDEIVALSGSIDSVAIINDDFINRILKRGKTDHRIVYFNKDEICEFVMPLDSLSYVRIGYTMYPYLHYKHEVVKIYAVSVFISFIIIILIIYLIVFIERSKKLQKRLSQIEIKQRVDEEIKNMAAWTAHEIRNPLNSLSIGISRIKDGDIDDEIIEIMDRNVKRLSSILNDFLSIVRDKKGEKVNVLSHIKGGIDLLKMEIENNNVEIEIIKEGKFYWNLDSKTGISIFSNLIKNAIEAEAKRIKITVYDNRITICNDGKPIGDIKDKIFEPFATTKSEGSGIGLAMVKMVLSRNGMDIDVEEKNNNVCFIIIVSKSVDL